MASNRMTSKGWVEITYPEVLIKITYPFPNFNGFIIDVLISNFMAQLLISVINYLW